MKKSFFGVGFVAIILLLVLIFILTQNQTQNGGVIPQDQTSLTPTASPSTSQPTDEQAELVGYGFIQDFIAQGPPEPDLLARQRAYDALSEGAKENVSDQAIGRDLALFVGVQDIPDQGASVEDLQISEGKATLIVGLNFSGGRILRAVNLVVENNKWKIDNIEPLDEYRTQ